MEDCLLTIMESGKRLHGAWTMVAGRHVRGRQAAGVRLSFARMTRSEEWGMNGKDSPPKP